MAIVTGADTGVGGATVLQLRREGHTVIRVLAEGPGDDGPTDVVGDPSSGDTAARAVAAAVAVGELRTLVVAGLRPLDRAFTTQTDDEWRDVADALMGTTRTMCRAVVSRMQADASAELAEGPLATALPRRIVLTMPATTLTATAGGSASAAAGGAVQALTRTLARELGGYGIRVNCVCLGYLADERADELPEPVRQMAAATTALGRFGTVEEAAAVYAFAASDAADYMTGTTLNVTGGLLGT